MEETTLQVIAIIATVAALLGWVIRFMFKYFTKKLDARDSYLEKLVEQNQENVNNFKDTINHHQSKFNASIDGLTKSITDQTEMFKEFIPRRRK
jgi:predicted PurR-regulated permease PerM